jgi:hypothetical protein
MIPVENALTHLSGIMMDAPARVAMVEGPQRYDDLPKCDMYASRNLTFYEKILPAMGVRGGASFVGTGGIFRRSAIFAVGGVPTYSITEDAALSMELQLKGFHTLYTKEALAYGTSPQHVAAMLAQRSRWIRGGYQILVVRYPFLQYRLPLHVRLFWTNSLLWYLTSPITLAIFCVLASAILTGAAVVPIGGLIRVSFIYVMFSKLSWLLFIRPGNYDELLIQLSDNLVADSYYNLAMTILQTYLLVMYCARGARKLKFKTSGEAWQSMLDTESTVCLSLLAFFSTFFLCCGASGVMRVVFYPHNSAYFGELNVLRNMQSVLIPLSPFRVCASVRRCIIAGIQAILHAIRVDLPLPHLPPCNTRDPVSQDHKDTSHGMDSLASSS